MNENKLSLFIEKRADGKYYRIRQEEFSKRVTSWVELEPDSEIANISETEDLMLSDEHRSLFRKALLNPLNKEYRVEWNFLANSITISVRARYSDKVTKFISHDLVFGTNWFNKLVELKKAMEPIRCEHTFGDGVTNSEESRISAIMLCRDWHLNDKDTIEYSIGYETDRHFEYWKKLDENLWKEIVFGINEVWGENND